MRIISEYTGLLVPDYALPYLINGDSSGLEKGDAERVDAWMRHFYAEAEAAGGRVIFDAGESAGFTWRPEFGLACDVTECKVLVVK